MFDDKPGTHGALPNTRVGWTLEDEIAWLEHEITYQSARLDKLYKERAKWERFITYCNGKKIDENY